MSLVYMKLVGLSHAVGIKQNMSHIMGIAWPMQRAIFRKYLCFRLSARFKKGDEAGIYPH
eukprot:1162078-Pelagomonas_calceolata.AAC.6